ncbi:SDF2-like protein [Mya arenaria]|uniref:SDF2-like protein n=1 Tax=Mya arenaria TaxID=6604 RepID=A0ABY7EM24_MYAAR|nr:SDF2-like protein [Mya arenaria]
MDAVKVVHVICSFLAFLCTISTGLGFQYDYVTCGSSLKLLNPYHNVRLHSHDVKYGSGSSQQTRRNLHSHHFQSPLSHNLEVRDNWVIVCSGKHWSRKDKVRIKNVVTEHYLHVSGDTFGRPISGQREVSAYASPNDLNYWQVQEGIFITPSEDPVGTYRPDTPNMHHQAHTEL